jgi:hypothetical protein
MVRCLWMINRVGWCPFGCTVPTLARRVGANLRSAEYNAGIRLYTKPTTGISGGAVHPMNCCLWNTFHEMKLPRNGSVRYVLGGRGLIRRQYSAGSFLFAFHCCFSSPLLDVGLANFPSPLSAVDNYSPSTSFTVTDLLYYRGSVTQSGPYFCCLPGQEK